MGSVKPFAREKVPRRPVKSQLYWLPFVKEQQLRLFLLKSLSLEQRQSMRSAVFHAGGLFVIPWNSRSI